MLAFIYLFVCLFIYLPTHAVYLSSCLRWIAPGCSRRTAHYGWKQHAKEEISVVIAGDRPPDHRIAAFCHRPSPHHSLPFTQQQKWWVWVQMLTYLLQKKLHGVPQCLNHWDVFLRRFTWLGVNDFPTTNQILFSSGNLLFIVISVLVCCIFFLHAYMEKVWW